MSNIIPQKGNLNRRVWKYLEQKVAKDYAQDFDEVWVVTGPIFDDKIEKLASDVEIPDACYKIVVDEDNGRVRMLAFIMDQDVSGREKLKKFLTSVDEIEKVTGLDFFARLPDDVEDRVEAGVGDGLW